MIDITPIESTPEVVEQITKINTPDVVQTVTHPVMKESPTKRAKTTSATINIDEVPSLT
jgi:hypothetical protein